MADEWQKSYEHPVKEFVIEAGMAIINGIDFPVRKAIEHLKLISEHPNNYCALSIVYFSCNDVDGRVDEIYNQIINKWESA